ncbi:GDSL-type esterase/lipase family protein [Muriicola marianensis]|uniref:SGNH hydrolase-type esterase domain-containing protein n=1 Tax=Muriicola marianensis TaxID=1324801 RepID=A0ABQ1R687_9FLAO|nr:GDSL-type esterase/lipase family protein [Muriicola marianensis]GGD57146.1 hypothetical protein GCM10011361_24630 [Muriicola marianensis]
MSTPVSKHIRLIAFVIISCIGLESGISQKKEDFTEEVALISQKYEDLKESEQRSVVFTGSSSIRLWPGLEESFPDHQIINTGFGGSESKDLLKFIKPLILDFRPEKVFIYEGDNDLEYRKSPSRVLKNTKKILKKVWEKFPDTEFVLIAAKPSPERWRLKRRFQRLNRKLEEYALKSERVEFANIWDIMLMDEQLNESLFEEDGLHMNEKGYALWYEVLSKYIN